VKWGKEGDMLELVADPKRMFAVPLADEQKEIFWLRYPKITLA
jgi:hypothetical protein